MVKNSDGTYRIMSTYGGLYRALNAEMDDINAGKTPINCIFYPYDGTSNEKWVLEGGHKLSTPQIGQEQDQWCWDASARMSALTYVSSVPSQSDIATHIFGSPVNQGITYASQIQDAANYASGFTNYTVSDVLSQTDLINQLNSGNPVILKRGWYSNDGSIRQGGHATIVYGYNFTSTGDYIFLIHDPWPTVSNPWPTNNAGQSYTRTYSEIVDGNTDGTDTGRWENSIYR